jgi:DNA-binding HxlR family transcriptional regulator
MDQKVVGFNWKLDIRRAVAEEGVIAVCPTFDVIHGISGKWTAFVMMALAERPHRFGELRRLFPDISQRMLTQTLHDLQRDGYAKRTVLPTKPPSVEYALSPLGESLFQQLALVLEWSRNNHHAVLEARREFDAASRST